jgi:hypothetical protein
MQAIFKKKIRLLLEFVKNTSKSIDKFSSSMYNIGSGRLNASLPEDLTSAAARTIRKKYQNRVDGKFDRDRFRRAVDGRFALPFVHVLKAEQRRKANKVRRRVFAFGARTVLAAFGAQLSQPHF